MAKADERLTELLRIKLSPPLGMEGMRGGVAFPLRHCEREARVGYGVPGGTTYTLGWGLGVCRWRASYMMTGVSTNSEVMHLG